MLGRLGLVGTFLALLAGLLWLWFRADGAPTLPDSSAPERPPAAAAAAAGADEGDQTPADASHRRDTAAGRETAAARTREQPLPRHHRRVRVIDDRTREPVPFAEIAVTPSERLTAALSAAELRRHHRTFDQFVAAERFGLGFVADTDGMAIVPVFDRWAMVNARHDGRSGRTWVDPDLAPEEPVEVRLQTDESFTLTVVDALRRPLPGVPIGVSCERVRDGADVGDTDTEALGYTDERGVLVARALQVRRQHQSELRRFELYVTAPGLTTHRVDITRDPAAATLTIPVFGSVAVQVKDQHGEPVADRPALLVHLSTDTQKSDSFASTSIWDFAVESKVEFPYVGIGTPLVVYGQRAGEDAVVHSAGPAAHGARVEIGLTFQRLATGVRGRLTRADGQPIPFAPVVVAADAPVAFADSWSTTADAEGRFLRCIDHDELGQVTAVRVLAWENDRPLGGSTPIELRRDAIVDAGDLTLTFGEPIASGVLTTTGNRLPESRAWVEQQTPAGPQQHWQHTWACTVDIADDGHFAIFKLGGHLDRPMRVRFSADGCREVPPLPFQPGQHDLRVELRMGMTLRGRILVDPELVAMTERVQAKVLQQDGSVDCGVFSRSAEWSLVGHGLQPGPGTLVVTAGGLELAREDNLVFAAGAVDPRLDPLDLRGRLQVLRLRAVDAAGKVVNCRAEVAFRNLRTAAWYDDRPTLDYGVMSLPVPAGPLELALFSASRMPIRYEGLPGAVDLPVTSMQPVEITIEGLVGLPTTGRLLAEVEGPSTWATQRNLPPTLQPVSSRGLDRKTGVLSLRVADAVELTVRLVFRPRGAPRSVLATLTTKVAPDRPKVTVPLPAADRARIAAALANAR
ncbi:MAG: hypothetical protein IPK26_04800 [Planctomycetes bacterium]|nr:hypothetical protein [Planctomycetota bacterium]